MELKEYYKTRHIYAIINGEVIWAADERHDRMSAKEWLMGKRGMSEEEYENTIRGALYEDHITICRGSNYDSVVIDDLPRDIIPSILRRGMKFNRSREIWEIHNGCIPGEPGTDWAPRENLGRFATDV